MDCGGRVGRCPGRRAARAVRRPLTGARAGNGRGCDARVVGDVRSLIGRFDLRVRACFAASGHKPGSEQPLGLAIDPYRPAVTRRTIGRRATSAGRPAAARPAVRDDFARRCASLSTTGTRDTAIPPIAPRRAAGRTSTCPGRMLPLHRSRRRRGWTFSRHRPADREPSPSRGTDHGAAPLHGGCCGKGPGRSRGTFVAAEFSWLVASASRLRRPSGRRRGEGVPPPLEQIAGGGDQAPFRARGGGAWKRSSPPRCARTPLTRPTGPTVG